MSLETMLTDTRTLEERVAALEERVFQAPEAKAAREEREFQLRRIAEVDAQRPSQGDREAAFLAERDRLLEARGRVVAAIEHVKAALAQPDDPTLHHVAATTARQERALLKEDLDILKHGGGRAAAMSDVLRAFVDKHWPPNGSPDPWADRPSLGRLRSKARELTVDIERAGLYELAASVAESLEVSSD